jgi:hypothetical protein
VETEPACLASRPPSEAGDEYDIRPGSRKTKRDKKRIPPPNPGKRADHGTLAHFASAG